MCSCPDHYHDSGSVIINPKTYSIDVGPDIRSFGVAVQGFGLGPARLVMSCRQEALTNMGIRIRLIPLRVVNEKIHDNVSTSNKHCVATVQPETFFELFRPPKYVHYQHHGFM